MKKVLVFLKNSPRFQSILKYLRLLSIVSMVMGLLLTTPIFWMERVAWDNSWMNTISPYLLIPIAIYMLVFLFVVVPYFWYISDERRWQKDSAGDRKFLRAASILCSIIPGGMIYGPIAQSIMIPTGIHNIIGMLIFGIIYMVIIGLVLNRPFKLFSETWSI